MLRSVFSLCDSKNRFIYEVCKDLFGDELTAVEIEYWVCYNLIKTAEFYKADIGGVTFDEAIKIVEQQKKREK